MASTAHGVGVEDWKQIQDWNSHCPKATHSCLHDLIHQRCQLQPDAIAICAWDGQMTYKEFDEVTSRLSCWLLKQGVKNEERVPICFEKGKWAVVTMVAILKAGAVFAPLDFIQPPERLGGMVEDLDSSFLATSTFTADLLQDMANVTILVINQDLLNTLSRRELEIPPSVNSDQAAFIMFTSGSTGKPSGVVIQHSAMATAAHAYAAEFGLSPQSRVMQFTSFIWLPCSLEIIANLIFGGRICIPSEEDRVNNAARFMCEHQVNLAVLTPSFLGSLLPEDVPTLEVLGLGGEKVPQHIVNRWADSVKLVLAYGSTETNIAMLQTVKPGPFNHMAGHAVNAALWIVDLDNSSQLAVVGKVGELVVESWSLAKEYLNDTEKSCTKFLDSGGWLQALPRESARFCRVGDLARYLPDGTVEILGRRDSVVKIRGQRVEPNDVEVHVRAFLPPTADCVLEAVALKSDVDELRLICFIAMETNSVSPNVACNIIRSGEALDRFALLSAELEERLSRSLPHYMLPSFLIPMESFPLTPTGKVDRRKVRSIAAGLSILDMNSLAIKRSPSSSTEIILSELWSALLSIPREQIGLDDDFFRLGGDSVKSIKLVSEARRRGLSLTVNTIFKNPKLCEQALASSTISEEQTNGIEKFELIDIHIISLLCAEVIAQCKIPEVLIEDIYPCTSLQAGLFSLTQKKRGAYMVRSTIHLPASLDLDRFREAWDIAAQLNPILRTRLVQTHFGLFQAVLRERTQWSEHESLDHYLLENMQVPMESGDRLAQYTIIKDIDQGLKFVWTAHHASFDAWSVQKTFRLVESIYLGKAERPGPGFKHFIKHIAAMEPESQKKYWEKELSAAPGAHFPRLPSLHYEPVAGAVLKEKLHLQRNPRSRITSATIVRAAWAILLALHLDTDDVVFGSIVNGRTLPILDIENILGPTIATVPVRVKLDFDKSIPELLEAVQHQATNMMPFEQMGLQNIRQLSADIHGATSFQTLITTQTATQADSVRFLDIEGGIESSRESTSTYALNVECTFISDGILCDVAFDPQVIPDKQMGFLLHQFEHILQQLCLEDPMVKVRDVDALSQYDIRQLWTWNKDMPAAVERCSHHIFHEQAILRPNSPAVEAWDGQWTYKELDDESDKLAHYLIQVEMVKLDDIVPVCFEKSRWMILTMLALWKAGACFAPIDAGHPNAWLEKILQDSGSELMLVSELRSKTLTPAIHRVIINDSFVGNLPKPASPTNIVVNARNNCYVIYTSGSTGLPKGIVHQHRSFVTGALDRMTRVRRTPKSRHLQFVSYSFDVSIDDIWLTLLAGGILCIPSDHERNNDTVGYMNRANVTSAFLTPSFARTMRPDMVPTLKVLSIGGEPSTTVDRDIWAGSVALFDQYGPAEISVFSHIQHIKVDTEAGDIGTPSTCLGWITHTFDHNKLQGIGIAGELLLEGPILSRGYLNQDLKTKEAFIENPAWLPFEKYGVRRLYKTGDLARISSDGSFRILGRKDGQTKVRAQRVELGQIQHEAKKLLNPDIDVIVDLSLLPGSNETEHLVVFVPLVFQSQLTYIANCLYPKLLATLPRYMVPTAVASLDVPTNISGKLDRRKLKEASVKLSEERFLFFSATMNRSEMESPDTETEKLLQDLWARTLNISIEKIYKHNSFIQLGGDSIQAMKMVAIANRDNNGSALTVEDIFRHPVLSEMAAALSEKGEILQVQNPVRPFELLERYDCPEHDTLLGDISAACQVDPSLIQDVYPCSALQEGIFALSIKHPGFYVSQLKFDLPQTVDLSRFRNAVGTVVASTSTLRTRIVQRGSAIVQVVLKSKLEWEFSNNLDDYLVNDKKKPMGLGQPLARHAIITEGDHKCFVWTLHHVIYDGQSLSLATKAVEMVYHNRIDWRPRIEYNQFIKYITSMDREANITYWSSQLSNAAESLAYYPRLPSSSYTPLAECSIEFEVMLPDNRRGERSEITTSNLCRAAWALLISEYSESNDVVFGATLSGRTAPLLGIDEIVGPVFTTVPVRVRLDLQTTVDQYLSGIQAQSMEMIQFEHFGLHNIREIDLDAQIACSFQTLLVVQPTIHEAEEANDPALEKLFNADRIARDLSQHNPYAIMIQLTPFQKKLLLNVSFDSHLIDEFQMMRMLRQFENILAQLYQPRDVNMKLSEVEIVTSHDKMEVLAWNRMSDIPEASKTCVHHVIKTRILEQPDAPAVLSWDGELTYRELDMLSANLSHFLVSLGVGPETIVPICMEKSMWTVVCVLSTLKAGGAFVLLDPSHPLQRLTSMIRDTKTHVILSSQKNSARLNGSADHIIEISESWMKALPHFDTDPVTNVQPNNLACVVFTSGSTGTPKGIELQHASICTSIAGHGPGLNINRKSRVFQFSSYAFDMAVYETITSLQMGALVCVPSEYEKVNNLVGAMNTMMINWAFFTPSTINLFRRKDVPTLETLAVGGEALSQEIVDDWAGNLRLIQCSGPAETSICMLGEMSRTTPKNCLGRGVNALCWIIRTNNEDALAPIGTVGELVIEGPGLARGYLNMSSKRWIEKPAWTRDQVPEGCLNPARRMYKTGDLVRYNSDGTINFIGRRDTQIKLRGQRLELTEVEDCLRMNLPDIEVAAELILVNKNSNPILASFISTSQESRLGDAAATICSTIPTSIHSKLATIDVQLAQSLPHYMIPSLIIPLTKMPLNASGKLHRNQLRQLGSSLTSGQLASFSTSAHGRRAPSTEMEQKMQILWGEVLNVDVSQISADANFLRLGGDSISAMRLVAVARREGVSLTVANVFQQPILCDLAILSTTDVDENQSFVAEPFSLLGNSNEADVVRQEVATGLGLDTEKISDIYPCSALQEGLMALSIQKPGSYIAQEVYKFPAGIDLQHFKAACEEVAATHSILRTRIVQLKSSSMMQVVLQEYINWLVCDNLSEYLEKDRKLPMQLGDPLTRWALIGSEEPYFVWTKHHSTYDGFSSILLLKKISDTYNNQRVTPSSGNQCPNFRNFIKYATGIRGLKGSEYWRGYLAGATRTKFPRAVEPLKSPNPHKSVSQHITFKRVSDSLITTSTILRASWALLLARYTGSSDVVFGATLSGRNAPLPGIEGVIGPTFTTVPIRVTIDEENMFVTKYLEEIQDQTIRMMPYEQAGLVSIKRISNDIREACDFQTLLVVQPMPEDIGNSILVPQRIEGQSTFRTYALTLDCRLTPDGLLLTAHFDPDLIEEKQMLRVINHFQNVVLELALGDPLRKVKDINMITSMDENEIWGWNKNVPQAASNCVHELMEQKILCQPDSPAVCAWDGNFSYGELSALSSRLADCLISRGVGPEVLVPILFEKSKWVIVGILAILRAGGAFVPLDPSHPPARLQSLISRIYAKLVLTSAGNESLCLTMGIPALVVDAPSLESLPDTQSWRSLDMSPQTPVYVSFTSGSTGQPKAVVIEHSAYCSGAREHIPKIAIDNTSRVLQFASHSFDTFFEDVLSTLIVGACIVIPSEIDRTSDISGVINRMGVNWAHLTPSFSDLIEPESVPGLKVLLLGGEAMSARHVRRWGHRLHLINVYGPSELCVTCSVNPRVINCPEAPDMGYPVGGVAWITDIEDHNKLSPVGTVGELLIEGPLMARGYLDDPDKTSEIFIQAPNWLQQGAGQIPGRTNRLYKTGDLARYASDGRLMYMGRKDAQVKLRGQRIELGEVEFQVRDCLAGNEANVAVDIVSVAGAQALAAFIAQDTSLTVSDHAKSASAERKHFNTLVSRLSEQLSALLPTYMIPTYFIPLAHIPLNMSKKTDRKRLQSIASEMSPEELSKCTVQIGNSREPETKLERQVRLIWSQVLNKPIHQISLNSSFVAIGGDSISAMQVLSRYRRANIQTTLYDVLRLKTIASFCEYYQAVAGDTSDTLLDLEDFDEEFDSAKLNGQIKGMVEASASPGDDGLPFELSPIQRRFFELYPNGNNSYQLSHLLRLGRWVTVERLSTALEIVVELHSMLRSRFSRNQNAPWEQRITKNAAESFQIRSHAEPDLQSLEHFVSISCRSVNIETGPLLAVDLITTPREQVLYLTAHHLAIDLVSWRIVLQDLEEVLHTTSSSPTLQATLPYPSWCRSLVELAGSQLDPTTVLPFTVGPPPLDYWGISGKPSIFQGTFIARRMFLDQELSSALLDRCHSVLDTTLNNVLLTAIVHSFTHVFTDREPPTVFNVSHGRHPWKDSIDVSRTVGWFTTMHPVQVSLQPEDDFHTTLQNVTKVHEQVSSQSLQYFASRYLNPEGMKLFESHSLMEIAFNYAGMYQQLERKDALFQELSILNHDPSHREAEVRHSSVFEIVARLQEGRLGFGISFSPDMRYQEKIELWVIEIQKSLEEVARTLLV